MRRLALLAFITGIAVFVAEFGLLALIAWLVERGRRDHAEGR